MSGGVDAALARGAVAPGDAEPESPAAVDTCVVHATAVRWRGRGVLLCGPSGVGKSDLALRLIEQGGRLVADDLVRLARRRDGRLVAGAHGPPGLIELRGQGIFRLPALRRAVLDLCVELGGEPFERLPERHFVHLCGVALPAHRLEPRAASATARLAVLLRAVRVA